MKIVRNGMHVWENHLYKFNIYHKQFTFCKHVQTIIHVNHHKVVA